MTKEWAQFWTAIAVMVVAGAAIWSHRLDWSSEAAAWVQAVGSIVAVLAGFGYVILQHAWTRAAQKRQQREVRTYTHDLCVQICKSMDATLKTFEILFARKTVLNGTFGRDGLDILSDELLGLRPSDFGHANFTLLARKVGLHTKAFAHIVTAHISGDRPLSEPEIATMRKMRREISRPIAAMKILLDRDEVEESEVPRS